VSHPEPNAARLKLRTVNGDSRPASASKVHPTDMMSRLATTVRPIRASGVVALGMSNPPQPHPGRTKSAVIAKAAWRMIRGW
jgi:hypothetical protein